MHDLSTSLLLKKKLFFPVENSPEFARLLGHAFFDGCVVAREGKYILNYTNASQNAVNFFIKLVKLKYGLNPSYCTDFKRHTTRIFTAEFYCKKLYFHLLNYSNSFSTKNEIGIPDLIKQGFDECKIQFLKAFWDDESCIDVRGRLSGCSKSEKMIFDLVELHAQFGIICTKSKNLKGISVLRILNNSRSIFAEKINFDFGIICRGYNKGRLKKDVLNSFIDGPVAQSGRAQDNCC